MLHPRLLVPFSALAARTTSFGSDIVSLKPSLAAVGERGRIAHVAWRRLRPYLGNAVPEATQGQIHYLRLEKLASGPPLLRIATIRHKNFAVDSRISLEVLLVSIPVLVRHAQA